MSNQRINRLKASLIVLLLASTSSIRADPHISFSKAPYEVSSLTTQALFYAKKLGLNQNVFIRIHFTSRLSDHIDATLDYKLEEDSIHQVIIYINQRIARTDQLLAIAHELIHTEQYVSGRLKQVSPTIFSWDKKHINILRCKYQDRPWEKEAHRRSKVLKASYLTMTKKTINDP